MIADWSPSTVGTLCVVLLLVTAGCTAGPIDGDDVDAETVVENVDERQATIDDLQGTYQTTVETDGEITTTTFDVWEKPPDMYREEVRSTNDDIAAEGDITVSNETGMWTYSAADDTVRTFDIEGDTGLGAAEVDDEALVDEALESFDVVYEGTETIADRDAHHITLIPSEDADNDGLADVYNEIELWVDAEYWYPLQQRAETNALGESMTVTTTFEEIEFNTGVADDRFAFDPPADAEIADEITTDEYETIDDASAVAPFDVADPAVPDEFTLETVRVIDDGVGSTSAEVAYTGPGDDRLSLSMQEDSTTTPDGESVSVDGIDATFVAEPITSLHWECGDLSYTLSGDLEKAELIDTAESVDCS